MSKFTIKVKADILEYKFIEALLNMHFSGVTNEYITFCISLYAITNNWKYDKLLYYLKLLEIGK